MNYKRKNQNVLLNVTAVFLTMLMMVSTVEAKEASKTLDLTQLEGTWIGEYSSLVNNRQGYINLTLEASSTKAVGGLSMVAGKKNRTGKPGTSRSSREKRKPLDVTFVEAEGGMIKGTVAIFTDPQSGLEIETIFRGDLVEDGVIEGVFSSTLTESGHSYTGSWNAVRVD
jgi:hypothetical protein